jgi:hypothetical protein
MSQEQVEVREVISQSSEKYCRCLSRYITSHICIPVHSLLLCYLVPVPSFPHIPCAHSGVYGQ